MTSPSLYKDQWLQSHNIHRTCCNVPQLEWDDTLAQKAQDWADWLKNNFNGMSRHPNASDAEKDEFLSYDGDYTTSPIGQNIAWYWGRNMDNGGNPPNSVDSWYAEGEFYDPSNPSLYCDGCDPESGDELGHFTQLCWKGTTKVGCGFSETFNDNVRDEVGEPGDENSSVWVCNYSPAGNVIAADDPYARFRTNVGTWKDGCSPGSGLSGVDEDDIINNDLPPFPGSGLSGGGEDDADGVILPPPTRRLPGHRKEISASSKRPTDER